MYQLIISDLTTKSAEIMSQPNPKYLVDYGPDSDEESEIHHEAGNSRFDYGPDSENGDESGVEIENSPAKFRLLPPSPQGNCDPELEVFTKII
jgi:hypothetical protein